jgi:hypothetical protein
LSSWISFPAGPRMCLQTAKASARWQTISDLTRVP